jgi:lipopolysaccharide biosynthesis glycosyltransferase
MSESSPASGRPVTATDAPLPVIFALHDADGAYWLNTAVAMTSLAVHARRPISISIIHDHSLGAAARDRLIEIAEDLRTPVSFIAASLPSSLDAGGLPGFDPRLLQRYSPASLFRLMIPELFAEADLVVYLDSDLVLNGLDIHELAAATPADAPLAAVADPFIGRHEPQVKQLGGLGLDPNAYFNSGVLALRPKRLPKDLVQQFIGFVLSGAELIHPDQDFLNCRFAGEVHLLDERFNTLVGFEDQRMIRPVSFYAQRILHYTGGLKPLSGAFCPAFVPFFAHAFKTPEIYSGGRYDAQFYLFPVKGRPDQLKGKRIDRDPD